MSRTMVSPDPHRPPGPRGRRRRSPGARGAGGAGGGTLIRIFGTDPVLNDHRGCSVDRQRSSAMASQPASQPPANGAGRQTPPPNQDPATCQHHHPPARQIASDRHAARRFDRHCLFTHGRERQDVAEPAEPQAETRTAATVQRSNIGMGPDLVH